MADTQTIPPIQTESAQQKQLSYCDQFLHDAGITPQQNKISIYNPDYVLKENEYQEMDIFTADRNDNLHILVYTLRGELIPYKEGNKTKFYEIVRYKNPKYDAVKDKTTKYIIPKGLGTRPFFPPPIVKKFADQTQIDTLVLTEGAKKAFVASIHGMDCIGLVSFTTLEDKSLKELHPEILEIIKTCKVKRVVLLLDGDCLDILKGGKQEIYVDEETKIPIKLYANGKDLHERPDLFFKSILKFRQLLEDYDCDKWFVHILSEDIDGSPKGIDDLFIQFKGNEEEIISDFNTWSKGILSYFYKQNITGSAFNKLSKYFFQNDINAFYLFHVERRPNLKDKNFIYLGTQYQYDEKENTCKIIIPANAKDYIRVGTRYYKKIKAVNQFGEPFDELALWDASTIKDDYGKDFIKHIPKYEAFCNLPSHDNFQDIIHNNYNLYYPVSHELLDGSWDKIKEHIQHIFGTKDITYKDVETGEKKTINEYELGLDYIQLLYQKPQVKLPILCLVSRENKTAKSTFVNLLKAIFMNNIAGITNNDFKNNFNQHWVTKLIVYCSETLLEKAEYTETIKNLSDEKDYFVNSKGVNQFKVDIFIHFIFLSNNEENFMRITEYDTRFWVRKVPIIANRDPHYLEKMIEQIPAFLHFLNERKLATKDVDRMWFQEDLIKTDALKRVVLYNKPTIVKEIKHRIAEMFLDFPEETEIKMTKKSIKERFFKGLRDDKYLEEALKNELKVDMYKDPQTGKYTTLRHQFPIWLPQYVEGKEQVVKAYQQDNGRPYIFYRRDFIDPETDEEYKHDDEQQPEGPKQITMEFENKVEDDMPF